MKRFLSAALLCSASLAYGIKPFQLPWMNHGTAGALYHSHEQPCAILVVEAYFKNCPYCNDNAPQVNELADAYSDEPRVQVLDVGVDRSDDLYEAWIRQHRPNHPVLKDSRQELIRQLGTTGYPSTYIIDWNGKVHYSAAGMWNSSKLSRIRGTIDNLLNQTCYPMPILE